MAGCARDALASANVADVGFPSNEGVCNLFLPGRSSGLTVSHFHHLLPEGRWGIREFAY